MAAMAKDIAEGYVSLNPLVLKKFDADAFRGLLQKMRKLQTETRTEKFPMNDTQGIRRRNTKLQRLHHATVVLEHAARERRISLV